MPKFYIKSGDFQTILDRPDSDTAALDSIKDGIKFLELNPVKKLSAITIVSEHGFSTVINEDDYVYNTIGLLEDTDLLGIFKPEDWM